MDNLRDYIQVYDDILDKETCDAIIKRFEEEKLLQTIESEIYKFDQLNVSKADNWKEQNDTLSDLAFSAATAYFNDVNVPLIPELKGFEEIRIKRFRPDQNERFELHVDVNMYLSAKRFLTVYCFLNTPEGGSEIYFPTVDLSIKPRAGRVAVFPPMWMFPYEIQTPTSNNSYLVGTYLHYM